MIFKTFSTWIHIISYLSVALLIIELNPSKALFPIQAAVQSCTENQIELQNIYHGRTLAIEDG